MVLSGGQWAEGQRREALEMGTQKLILEHIPFLREDFALMVEKGRWVVLPYSVDKELPGLSLI